MYENNPKYIKFYDELNKERIQYRNKTIVFLILFLLMFLTSLVHLILIQFLSIPYIELYGSWMVKGFGIASLVFLVIAIFVLEEYKEKSSDKLTNFINELFFVINKTPNEENDRLRKDFGSCFYESKLFARQDLLLTDRYRMNSYDNKMAVTFDYSLQEIYLPASKSGKRTNQIISKGIFTAFKVQRDYEELYIIEKSTRLFDSTKKSLRLLNRVRTGSKDFDKRFKVYSKEKAFEKRLLTENVIEKIPTITAKTKAKTFISFKDNKIYLVLEVPKNIRLPLFTSINIDIIKDATDMVNIPKEILKLDI